MTRRRIAVFILLAWVGALGWLGAREYARRGRTVVAGRQAVSPGAAYYRVELPEGLVGYELLQVDTLAATDTAPALVLLQHRLLIAGGDAPAQARYEILTNAWLTTDLRLRRANTLRGDPDGVTEWKLAVTGDTLRTMFIAGPDTSVTALVLDTIPVPVEAVPLWLATYARPRPGRAASVPAIDLSTLARRRETWTATAESTFTVPDSVIRLGKDDYRIASYDTVQGWRLSATDRSVQVHQWLDENGFPIRRWTGGGLRHERDAFELAITAFRRVSDSLTGRSPLRSPAGVDLEALAALPRSGWSHLLPGAEYPPLDAAGPTQRIAGDTVETFEPRSWRSQMALRPVAPLPVTDPRFAMELAPEPRLSPEDTAVTAHAVALQGASPNPRDAAYRLQDWVTRNVRTESPAGRAGARTAGAVLAARAGTPEEKAILLVALARRIGLPARLVGGVLLAPKGPRAHTWVEVFVGDWIPLDPAQAGFIASPSHVRLVTGATGRWTDLLPLAGALVATERAQTEIR
jgi:transglutaminase-like putative cysteine protease